MDEVCPIDAQFAAEITALLTPSSPQQAQEYYDQIISKRQCRGIIVKQNGEYGKGVFADMDFSEEELIMKDQMLVGAQHSSNKINCLVCSRCFRFIGSIQLQIGRRFYLQQLGISSGCCESDSSDSDDHDDDDDKYKSKFRLPAGVVESLVNEEMPLPYYDKFCLPPALPCPGGCNEVYYCSKSCSEADWDSSHSLLCTGERSESVSVEALLEFINHANETNDIFVLAAKVISSTILRYRKLKATRLDRKGKALDVPCAMDLSLLLDAWKPISMGHKRRWWDCIALPVDVESSDEATFRMQIRSMAYTSLKLLKAAIFDKECEPLFSLEIYGHIIGMFELNNLDLVVASPVEDYFLYIDDLPYAQKKQTEEITRPLFNALGDDYSVCCQGTAFFPLQSCMNHSCSPNAKAFKRDEDKDGQATIVALKPICKGEEVTISYIDEDLPFEERQALLADYGFRCRCPKCLEEEPRHSYS